MPSLQQFSLKKVLGSKLIIIIIIIIIIIKTIILKSLCDSVVQSVENQTVRQSV